MNTKTIVLVAHCSNAGPASPKPGTIIRTAVLQPLQDHPEAKESNAANFERSVPGLTFQLGNLTEAAVKAFEPGKVYKITVEQLPDKV